MKKWQVLRAIFYFSIYLINSKTLKRYTLSDSFSLFILLKNGAEKWDVMNILTVKKRLANLVRRFTQGRRRCGGIWGGGRAQFSRCGRSSIHFWSRFPWRFELSGVDCGWKRGENRTVPAVEMKNIRKGVTPQNVTWTRNVTTFDAKCNNFLTRNVTTFDVKCSNFLTQNVTIFWRKMKQYF